MSYHNLIRSPWVLVDDTTIDQTAALLEHLTSWLLDGPTEATAACAICLSRTNDPDSLAERVDDLAGHLHDLRIDSTIPDLTT